jgi:hypothetical protein
VSEDAWREGGLKTRAYDERLWAYCRRGGGGRKLGKSKRKNYSWVKRRRKDFR